MTRKIIPILVALALGYPQGAPALALGDLKVRSSLNEPFDAEIELLSVRGDDLADLKAKLASPEEFLRAGVDRPYILSRLRFKVEERPGGKAVLKVSSRQPVKEPFLNFLLEMNWPQGRLVREYTALLDPPVYGAAATAAVQGPLVQEKPEPLSPPLEMPAAEGSAQLKPVEVQPPPAAVAAEPGVASEGAKAAAPAPEPKVSGAESYGPVRAGDTLWSIANRVRPDVSVSTQQMMVALLQANPEAFAMGNVNALKSGHILRIPDRESLDAVTYAQALADLRRQHTAWEDFRQGAARTARPAPTAVAVAGPARKPAAEPAPEPAAVAPQSRLELVAAGTGEGSGTGGGGGTTALKRELTVLQEDLDGRRQEIAELQSRLAEAEALIQDLHRLIKLKDEALSALQQQALAAQGKAEEPVVTGPAPVPVVEPLPAAAPAGEAVLTTAPEAGVNTTEPEPTPLSAPPAAPAPSAPEPVVSKPDVAPAAPLDAVPASALTPDPTLSEVVSQQSQSIVKSVSENPSMFWGGLAGLLALVGGVFSVRRRRPAEKSPGPAAATRPDEPSTAVVSGVPRAAAPSVTTVAQATFVEPVEEPVFESPTAEVREEDFRAEDPMAEVNVYLAYERFTQAEKLVREAIAAHPERPEYRLKLLEVQHAAKNIAAFERDAAALRDAFGEDSPLLGRARKWWADLSPGRALFAPAAVAAAAATVAPAMAPAVGGSKFGRTLNLSMESTQATLDLGLGSETAAGEPAAEGLDLGGGAVDFDLGLVGTDEPSSEFIDFDLDLGHPDEAMENVAAPFGVGRPAFKASDRAIAAALAEATEALDLDLSEGFEAAEAEPENSLLDFELESPPTQRLAEPSLSPAVAGAAELSVDLRLEPLPVSAQGTPLAPGVRAVSPAVSQPAEPPSRDLALEPLDLPAAPVRTPIGVPDEVLLSLTPQDSGTAFGSGRLTARAAGQGAPEADFELDLDVSGGEPDEASFFLDGEALGSLDEVGTKLDLARAYIDMGDTEGARGILGEVLIEGNDTQQGEARELLAGLAS